MNATWQPFEVTSWAALHEMFRERRAYLRASCETINAISGLPDGYVAKVLSDPPMKNIGPKAFEMMLGAMGMKLIAVHDDEAHKRVASRLTQSRQLAAGKIPPLVIKISIRRLRKLAKDGGNARAAKLSKRRRIAIARKAGRASARKRWRGLRPVVVASLKGPANG